MIEWFDFIAAAVLSVCLYLAYAVYNLKQDIEDIEEQSQITLNILLKFIEKIADDKVKAGEWTEDETF